MWLNNNGPKGSGWDKYFINVAVDIEYLGNKIKKDDGFSDN